MVPSANTGDQLSPLDQIRQAEAGAASRVASAQQSAEQIILEARRQSESVRLRAVEEGRRTGELARDELLEEAQQEAAGIIQKGEKLAAEMNQTGKMRLDAAAQFALGVILGDERGNSP